MTQLNVKELDHIVLNVHDVDRSLNFYAGFLGLEPLRLQEFKNGEVPFPSIRVSPGTIIDLFSPAMHGVTELDRARNLNHLCLVVSETVDAIERHVRACGVPIERGPVNGFGARGIGASIYCCDPDGNTVEIRSYARSTARCR